MSQAGDQKNNETHLTEEGKELARDRWLTPGVWGIGLASFLADLGHEVPTALFASLVVGLLGAPAAILGLLEGLADGLAGVARLGGGLLADEPGRRRRIAVGGYASTAICAALIGAAWAVWQVALLRIGAWVARGLRVPARNALLADLVPENRYGRAYGFERMMDNLGAIGGPLLALGLVAIVGIRPAILLSVIPGLLAALSILFALRFLPPVTRFKRAPFSLNIRPLLEKRLRLRQVLLGVGLFEASNVAAPLLILQATQILTPGLGLQVATQVGLILYLGYNVIAALASLPAGRLSDRWGPLVVLMAGTACFALAFLCFASSQASAWLLVPAFLLAGLAIGGVETSEHTVIATLAPPERRGSAFGLLAAVQSFGNILASSCTGLLWSIFSPFVAFAYLAILSALATLALLWSARLFTQAEALPGAGERQTQGPQHP
ncbi:MAG: MFS transporter [Thermogemmatispora sp.]|jgi:MFS family permease|uniref:MFS transporter n=1 Tax=Thermogemmatispora sp. TaxID=1968838 RepID=UPI0019F7C49C|nr:MFS transporter [Thermogemmatispora sp.]MBE3568302.1 MFS transporter [Thermogemmatispora sp.]